MDATLSPEGWLVSERSQPRSGGRNQDRRPDYSPHRSKDPNITTPVVCRACNHEWMSDLETWASQTIDSMVRRHEQQALSIEDQAWLAVWGVKTAMMWMTVPPGERLIPLEDYHWLRIHKLPPPKFRVRIGRYEAGARGYRGASYPRPARGHREPRTSADRHTPFGTGVRPSRHRHRQSRDRRWPGAAAAGQRHLHARYLAGRQSGSNSKLSHAHLEGDEMFQVMDISPDTELPNPTE